MRKENTTLYEWEERRVRRSSYAGHTSVGEKRRGGCRFIAADWQTHKCRHRSKRAREVPPHFQVQVSASVMCLHHSRELEVNQTIYKRPLQMFIRVVLYTGRRFACIFIVQHIPKRFILPIDQVDFAFKWIRLPLYYVNVNFAFRASDCLCMRLTLQSRQ